MFPEFPSDVFITFEALDAKVWVKINNKTEETVMSLADYLNNKTSKMVLIAFELPAYSSKEFLFKSYKVDNFLYIPRVIENSSYS